MIILYFKEKKVEILYYARHGIVAQAGTGEQLTHSCQLEIRSKGT